ncbi:hypothetical protein [Polyangium sp. 15x6]|uniref:hypothetical protein n=1 Tax=Polyangium sp. 15x6 TaxID=3042687 RepID=UPI002499C1E5|nr:hypothetical protein [Polyangium sp. 15x6]
MYLRPFGSFAAFALSAVLVGGLCGYPSTAFAAGEKDKEALKLHDQAMDEDYLAVEFDKAEKKLKDALKKCGDDGCSPKVLGKLHIALGTVYGGSNKLDKAKEEFIEALKADPSAALIESLTTPELTKAFEEAKKQAKPSKPTGPSKPPPSSEDGGEDGGDKPGGDLEHTPIPEQAVNTPVPVYIEIGDDITVEKATLRYKPFGASKWTSLEMQRVGKGWGAEIPCADVTTTGDVKYYIVVTDDGGEQLKAGSQKDPYRVAIKREIEGDEPSLPGKKPPRQCKAKEDCPPGLPGCEKTSKEEKRGEKGWGATCEADQECQAGLICQNGQCEEGKREDGDTGPEPAGKGKKNIIGLGGQLDLMLISSAENVCSGDNDTYYCFHAGTTDRFFGDPISATGTNGIQGGFGLAGGRAFASYDRELAKLGAGSIGAGLRFGIAFGGHPSSDQQPPNPLHPEMVNFPPIHGELRAWYSFGGSQFEQGKVRPFGFLGVGLAKVSSSVPVTVCDRLQKNGEDAIAPEDDDAQCPGTGNRSAVQRELDAYQISGLNFISVGGGATYAITPNFGVTAEIKAMFMLTTFAVVIAPSLGPVFAF